MQQVRLEWISIYHENVFFHQNDWKDLKNKLKNLEQTLCKIMVSGHCKLLNLSVVKTYENI